MAEEYYRKIQQQLKSSPKSALSQKDKEFVSRYLGTQKKCLGIKTGQLVKIAKIITKDQDKISSKDLIGILNRLSNGGTFEEAIISGKIFTFLKPENRSKIPMKSLKIWLSKTAGWAEVDVLCQSSYVAEEILPRWSEWKQTINEFSKHKNIQVRRASLVLQNLSARKSKDEKIRKLALETVEKLKCENDVLITKAVSWLLRSLAVQHPEEVKNYLLKNESTLPRIAFRETIKKIETGKK